MPTEAVPSLKVALQPSISHVTTVINPSTIDTLHTRPLSDSQRHLPADKMYTILSVVIFIIVLKVWRRNARRLKLPYPPGPVGLPLIGNVSDLQPQHMWISTAELSKEYGDVIHLEILGHHIIILNTLETVKDLLDGRSAIYSDRERSPMVYEL